jgi:histone-lysine N-methyltransferase SETMAR
LILHHDGAPAYVALEIRQVLAKKSITKMNHSPYSPDLDPCDFLALSKIKKKVMTRQRFAEIPDIQHNVTMLLRGNPENDFQDGFWQRPDRLTKCTASQGEYFEVNS